MGKRKLWAQRPQEGEKFTSLNSIRKVSVAREWVVMELESKAESNHGNSFEFYPPL